MQLPIRELPRTEIPRVAIYTTGVTCGVLAAIAVEIVMSNVGIELSGVWRNLISTRALQVRSAGAWWLMAGSAFMVSAVVVALMSRFPLPWRRFRAFRWLLSTGVVFMLAEIGHMASTVTRPDIRSAGTHVAVSLAALGSAALIALFGGYFAVKR
jgi:hypothetical protein